MAAAYYVLQPRTIDSLNEGLQSNRLRDEMPPVASPIYTDQTRMAAPYLLCLPKIKLETTQGC